MLKNFCIFINSLWHCHKYFYYGCRDHAKYPEMNFLNNYCVVAQPVDWSLGLDGCSYCYLCLSPLPVLGVAFSSTIRNWVSVFQPSVRCLRLESLKPNTVYCSSSLSSSPHQSFNLLPHPSRTSLFALDTLHSCCHSARPQLQFIPSSWPFRVMHSPGRRGWAVAAAHVFIKLLCMPVQVCFRCLNL